MSKLLTSLLILFLVTIAYGQQNRTPDNLYENLKDSYVIELNSTTFDDEIYCVGKNFSNCSAYVVEFYTSASEFSRNYSDTYNTVANKLSFWQSNIVKLAAVNCHQTLNDALCKLHGFQRMPLLKYFDRNSPVKSEGVRFETNIHADHVIQRIIEKINNEYWVKEHADWPNFNELPDRANLTDIWNGVDECTTNYFIILVNNASDWAGAKVQTEVYKVADKSLPIRRANKNHGIVKLLNETVIDFPEPLMLKRSPSGANCTSTELALTRDFTKINALRGVGDTLSYTKEYYDGELVIQRRVHHSNVVHG